MKKVSVILLILLVITAFTACDPQMDQGPHIHVIDKETATAWFDADETKYSKAGVCSKCGETVTLEGISVSTPDELLAVAADINSKTSIGTALVNIANDIDMTDKAWTPFVIGNGNDSIKTLTIDGNGYTISHLKAEDAAKSLAGVGFIGEIRSNEANVEVLNLTVDSANFSDMSDYSTACAGGIAGYIDGGPSVKFINCHVTGSMIKSGKYAGGVFAWNGTNVQTTILVDGCTIARSEISGGFSGSSGGIVGHACASSTDTLNIKDSEVAETQITGSVYKGNIIGTVNAGTVSIENTKYHDNTSVNNDRYVGRVAFGETGSLTIDGVKVTEAQ